MTQLTSPHPLPPPLKGRGVLMPGRRLGQIEEYFIEGLTPGDTFIFAGEMLRFLELREEDALCARAGGEQAREQGKHRETQNSRGAHVASCAAPVDETHLTHTHLRVRAAPVHGRRSCYLQCEDPATRVTRDSDPIVATRLTRERREKAYDSAR